MNATLEIVRTVGQFDAHRVARREHRERSWVGSEKRSAVLITACWVSTLEGLMLRRAIRVFGTIQIGQAQSKEK
jgi:hypothetical protein